MYIVVQQYNLDLKTCDGMAMILEIYYFFYRKFYVLLHLP